MFNLLNSAGAVRSMGRPIRTALRDWIAVGSFDIAASGPDIVAGTDNSFEAGSALQASGVVAPSLG